MMVVQERLYTAEEFWKIAELPENQDKILELIEGVIVEMPPSSPTNTVTGGRVLYFLNAHVIPNDLGYVTGADGGFKLAPKTVRLPDVGFISKQRLAGLPKNFEIAPDLAVEIFSPNDSAKDVRDKVKLYLNGGTRLVWAVYPDEKQVDVYRLNADGSMNVRTFGVDDMLDGEDVLPGFKLPVRDIFPD